ncbi:hypothetical protein LX69_01365 [Breznakibacter xylanolyticus]|uniref:Uncharacterized protein n=1 Tax=Breznakibacter xylanolyticus TaxID=990 RepID=A0A2W7Q871_9BACT|nr:hypothetical protein [Breznakibacter xylanolyticus]PZX17949.1 hypothetical protein LX69_01365 [Breznakibacter xylanolyticus]
MATPSQTGQYGCSVVVSAADNQKHGFDAVGNGKVKPNNYFLSSKAGDAVPWKSLPVGGNDYVMVSVTGDCSPDSLRYLRESDIPTPSAPNGKKQQLLLTGTAPGDEEVLTIALSTKQLQKDSTTRQTLTEAGALGLVTYAPQVRNVVIVPVNDAVAPSGSSAVKTVLDKVFAPALVSWNVTVEPAITVSGITADGFSTTGLAIGSRYTPHMNQVIKAYKATRKISKNTLVLFFVTAPHSDKLGYMPLTGDYGFIFNLGSNLELLAHELSHGAFNLKHTFSDDAYWRQRGPAPRFAERTTQNLMDYTNGTELWKYQWDLIHNPETVWLGALEEEEGAAFREEGTKFLCINDANALAKLAKYQTLYLPDGKKADLKGKYNASGFYLADDVTQSARGAIYSLRINGYDNVQLFNDAKETKAFGYRVTDSTAVRSVTADALKADDDAVAYRVFIEKGNGNNGKITVKNGNETVETIDFTGDCNCNYHEKAEEVYFKTNSIAQVYVDYFQSRSLRIDQAIDKDNALIDQLVDAINRQKSAGLQDELLGNVLADKLRSYEKFNDRKFYVAVVPQNTLCLNQKAWNRLADAVFLKANLPDNAILITLPYVQCAGIGRDKGEFFFMPGLTFGGNIRIDLSGLAKSYQNTQNSAAFIADNTSSPMWTFVKDVFANTDKQYIRRYYYITAKGEIIGRSETAASHVGFPGTVDFRLMVDTRFFEYAKLLTESERYLDSKNLANNAHVIAAFNKRRLELNIALSNFYMDHAEPQDSVVVHGMNEYTGTSDETNCARFALWYRDRFYSPGTKQGSPGDDCFYAGRNMVVYNENIANIDALGLMLSPFGFDWVADAIGCVYAGYYCDFGNSAMYGLGIAVPVVSIVYVKGSAKALLSGLRRGQCELVQEGSGYAIRWISRQADGLDDLLRRLNSPDLEDAFKADFNNFTEATRKTFLEKPELVESWKLLLHTNIPATIRTNPTYLSAVSKQLTNYGNDVVFQFERVLPKIEVVDLPVFFKALDNPNSIDHVRSLVGDFENIPGISLTNYTPNGLPKSAIDPPDTWANPLLDLPAQDAPNFSNATAKTLTPGQKIYRVIGETPAGGYWTYDLPTSKADIFGGTAVRPEWNSATKYVEYTIPDGGLKVWDGPAASQRLLNGIDDVSLPGGAIQIYVPEPYRQIGNAFDNLNPVDLNFK